jgi:glycosyltransferase involved in cell wall biosynthesis
MRISFLLSSLQLSGGVQVIIEYANRLSARGHEVTLVAPGRSVVRRPSGWVRPSEWVRSSDPIRMGVQRTQEQVHRTRRTPEWVYDQNGIRDTSSQVMLDQVAPGVAVRTSRIGCKVKGPLAVWNLAQMARLTWSMARAVPPSDVVIATHTPTTAVSLLACHLLGRISSVRRGQPAWFFMDYEEMFAGRPYELWLMRHARHWHKLVLVLSHDSQRELDMDGAALVGLGLSHPELLRPQPTRDTGPGAAHRASAGKRGILYLGDARPRKGLVDFIRGAELASKRIDRIELWIASKEDVEVESTVPFRRLYRPTREELAELYATCDLFVSASWREGFGLPPLEAMACGAPVVLTDSGGVREYARHGENCLMVPPRDPPALAEAMVRVLTDTALAEQLRRNGPLTAARFTWEGAVDRFEEALGKLIEGKTVGTGTQEARGSPSTHRSRASQ